jgi:hypothetical protein
MRMIQRDLHRQLREQCLATRQRIEDLVRRLDAAQLVQRTEPTGWSAGEVLEHLCVTEGLYDVPLTKVLATARPDAGAPAREWKSSLFGGWLAEALDRPGKMRAPKAFQPGPTPRSGVVEVFLAQELRRIESMDDAASLDWRAVRLGSPALPGFMPKMNLGDVFRIHVVHVRRHAKQIERVVGKLDPSNRQRVFAAGH